MDLLVGRGASFCPRLSLCPLLLTLAWVRQPQQRYSFGIHLGVDIHLQVRAPPAFLEGTEPHWVYSLLLLRYLPPQMQREEERRSRRSGDLDDLESVLSEKMTVEMTIERRQLLLAELQTQLCVLAKKGYDEKIVAILERDEVKMPQVVEILGPKGRIDVNALSPGGETALLSAVDGDQLKTVMTLIDRGANVNKPGKDGVTALHSAAGFGRISIAKYLIAKGAQSTKDAEGDTPEDYAKTFDAQPMLELFDRWKRNPQETVEELKVELVAGYKEEKQRRADAEKAKRAAAEKKAKDAERAIKEKERAAKEAKALEAARLAAEEKRKSITLS